MQDDKFQLSKTKVATALMWGASVAFFVTGALMPHDRLVLVFLTASILTCGLAAAWTVRCFLRSYMALLQNAYQLGYDKGRLERDTVPLQRVMD